MSVLYIFNIGRQIHIQIDNIHVQYLGSKALNKFIKVNSYSDGCISLDTQFKIENQLETEEDYIDLRDVFDDYNYDTEKIIKSISKIEIGVPQMKKLTRNDLIEKSPTNQILDMLIHSNYCLQNSLQTILRTFKRNCGKN